LLLTRTDSRSRHYLLPSRYCLATLAPTSRRVGKSDLSLFTCVCSSVKSDELRSRSVNPSPKVPSFEAGTNLTNMTPQSASPAVRGARGGSRGVGMNRSQSQQPTGTAGNKMPTRQAPPPRLTHCNISSSIMRQKFTTHMGLVISLPIVSASLHQVFVTLTGADHTRATMQGCVSSWGGLDNLC